MMISDRRLERIWRRKVVPVADSIAGWDQVTSLGASSTWVPADPAAPVLFTRDSSRLGADLEAVWRANGRDVLLPLAPVMQDLVGRVSPQEEGASRDVSSTVYEMH